MTTHNRDVAAVLTEALYVHPWNDDGPFEGHIEAVKVVLAALTAADIACVYVPEGAVVGHGARLVYRGDGGRSLYAIEPPSEGP